MSFSTFRAECAADITLFHASVYMGCGDPRTRLGGETSLVAAIRNGGLRMTTLRVPPLSFQSHHSLSPSPPYPPLSLPPKDRVMQETRECSAAR